MLKDLLVPFSKAFFTIFERHPAIPTLIKILKLNHGLKKLFLFFWSLFIFTTAFGQPGKDGALTVSSASQVVNKYCPLSASISAGSSTLALANVTFVPLCPGDLVMVYQAQGASLNFTNTINYGAITAYNSAGLYEFKYVQGVSGNIVTLQSAFTNSYSLSGRPQLIKVPQYTTLTVNPGASIIPKEWKDTVMSAVAYRFGGLVVIHATDIINNGTITANGSGFRGGAIQNTNFILGVTSYVSSTADNGGQKGEGIFGYQTDYDANGGRYCRGAPANGGGGGNSTNAPGGGGANGYNTNTWTGQGVMISNVANPLAAWQLDPGYIANGNALTNSSGGGRGGYSYAYSNGNALTDGPGTAPWTGDLRSEVGGLGGRPLTNIDAENRIYFGGGGGGGHENNSVGAPGADGGGIIYLITTGSLSGSGNIRSNGDLAGNSAFIPYNYSDGPGGGGAGGSIILKTGSMSSLLNVTASGGQGGTQLPPTPNTDETEGGGGGGGGGFVAMSTNAVMPSVSGGQNGSSIASGVAEMPFNGATQGASGQTASVSTSFVSYTVPINSVTSNTPCSGASISFTSSSAPSYTWSGPNFFSSSVQNPIIPNSTTLMSGTYTVLLGTFGNCSLPVTLTLNVIVNSTPTLITTNTIICNGSTATLSASGANAYTWSPGNSTGNTFTTASLTSSVFTVTGLGAGNCTSSATATVTVPPALTLNISSSSPSACVPGSITLSAFNSGGTPGYTYTWTAGPSNSNYIISEPAGSYVYTISSTDLNNCIAVATTTVDFISNPVLSVQSVSICPGATGSLNVSGANSYTWYPPLYIGNSYTDTPAITTVYSVTGSNSGCNSATTATITVKPVPILSFQTATITCANLGSATVTATGGVGPFSYTWLPTAQITSVATALYPGDYTLSVFDNSTNCSVVSFTNFASLIPFTGTVTGTSSLACNGFSLGTASINLSGGSGSQNYLWTSPALTSQSSATATGLSAGIHTISVTDGITFCNVTHTFQITQPPSLTLNVNANPTIACVGVPVSLTATNSGGVPAYNYTWTANTVSVSSTSSITELTGGPYTYSVQSQDNNGCLATNTVTVMFINYPVIAASSSSICMGNTASLLATGANGYTWTPGNFIGNTFSASPLTNSSYTVIGGNFGCNDTTVSNITLYPLPLPSISGTNNVCEGQLLSLTGSGGVVYTWNGPSGSYSSNQVFTINPTALNQSGIYSLTVSSAQGCNSFTSMPVMIIAKPVITVTGANVCIGNSASLSVSGGTNYSWTGPSGFSSTSSLAIIPLVSNANVGIYTVVVTGVNSCLATGTTQLLASLYGLPVPLIMTDTTVCVNSTITLNGTGGSKYLWSGPGGFTSGLQSPNLFMGNTNMSGIYTLSVKNASNCEAFTTVSIAVLPLPTGTLSSYTNNRCIPFCSTFYLNLPVSQTYSIISASFQVQNLQVQDSAATFKYCFNTAGDYKAKVVLTDVNGCQNTSSLIISAWPLPQANFEYLPNLPVENVDYVIFTNTSTGENITNWNWYFNNNNGDSSEVRDPEHLYTQSGMFPVALVVKNKWGCSDTIVKSIRVNDDFSFYVPNSFTPNGDDLNNTFQPKGVGIKKYKLEIYDRWGEKLFTSTDFYTGWDGSYKGKECKADTYIWKIELTNPSGKILNYDGHVNIIGR